MCQQQLVKSQPSAAIVCASVVGARVLWLSPVLQGSPELVLGSFCFCHVVRIFKGTQQ
jgi:hypothetical protein